MFPFLNLPQQLQRRALWTVDILTLAALAASSREIRRLVRLEFAERRDDMLDAFVDKTTFLPEMEACHALITGQHSFTFLHAECAPFAKLATPLTFVVPAEHRLRLLTHLCETQHYQPIGPHRRFQYSGTGREVVLRRNTNMIKIAASPNGCPFWPITFFYPSAWMNAIGATHFYCAYPRFTLSHRSFLNPKHMLDGNVPSMSMVRFIYHDKLLDIDTRTSPLAWAPEDTDCPHEETCPLRTRSFVDKYALVMPMTPHDDFERPRQEGTCLTEWKLGGWESFELDTYLIPSKVSITRNT